MGDWNTHLVNKKPKVVKKQSLKKKTVINVFKGQFSLTKKNNKFVFKLHL